MWLGAAVGRSAISKQAPVTLIAECALLRRKRTAELANRIPSALGPSPWPTNREPRCALRSDDTNGTCLSGNRYRTETYVENHGLYLEVYTIEHNLMNANLARFKAECSLLHMRMFGESRQQQGIATYLAAIDCVLS